MASKWALAASLALAIIGLGAGDALAQSDTVWDDKPEPIEGRPSEYRTTTTETWIRLTPYVGWQKFDGGLLLTEGPVFGMSLDFDAGDVVVCSFDLGTNIPMDNFGAERELTRGRNGTDAHHRVEGHAFHPAVYVGVRNPELSWGILQPSAGFGFGAWRLRDYEGDLAVDGGGVANVRFSDTWMVHFSMFLRLDFEISDHFLFTMNFKNHIITYLSEEESVGNMEGDSGFLDWENFHYALEPTIGFSIAF